jgi:hypothetical protein
VASTGQSKNVISFLALSRTKKPSCCVINIRRNGGRGKELQQQQIAFVRSRRFVAEDAPRDVLVVGRLWFVEFNGFLKVGRHQSTGCLSIKPKTHSSYSRELPK